MRKIETAEELDRKKKRNARVGSIIMLLILVVSSLGYAFMSSDSDTGSQKKGSNGVYASGDRWALDISGGSLFFSNPPENVSDIVVDTNLTLEDYYQKPLYIVSEDGLFGNEISFNLGRYASRIQNACYGNCTYDYPEKDCNENLIVHTESSGNRVYQMQNCIFVDGDLKVLDAFLYKLFGVN